MVDGAGSGLVSQKVSTEEEIEFSPLRRGTTWPSNLLLLNADDRTATEVRKFDDILESGEYRVFRACPTVSPGSIRICILWLRRPSFMFER